MKVALGESLFCGLLLFRFSTTARPKAEDRLIAYALGSSTPRGEVEVDDRHIAYPWQDRHSDNIGKDEPNLMGVAEFTYSPEHHHHHHKDKDKKQKDDTPANQGESDQPEKGAEQDTEKKGEKKQQEEDSRKKVVKNSDDVQKDVFKLYAARSSFQLADNHGRLRKNIRRWMEDIGSSLKDGKEEHTTFEKAYLHVKSSGVKEQISVTMNISRQGDNFHVESQKTVETSGFGKAIADKEDVVNWNREADLDKLDKRQKKEIEEVENGVKGEGEADTENVKEKGHALKAEREKIVEQEYGLPVALALMGFFVFVLYTLYLLNNQDPQIRHSSYRIISLSIAIFAAVMLEKAQSYLIFEGILQAIIGEHAYEKVEHALLAIVSVCWFISMSYLCHRYKDSITNLRAIHGVFMHLGVFVAIDLFEGLRIQILGAGEDQEEGIIVDLKLAALSIVPVVVCKLLSMLMDWRRECWEEEAEEGQSEDQSGVVIEGLTREEALGRTRIDDGSEIYKEVVEECEIEFSGLLFGFLASKALQHAFLGKHDCDESGCDISASQQLGLLCIAVVLSGCFILSTLLYMFATDWRHFAEWLEAHTGFIASFFWLDFTDVFVRNQFSLHNAVWKISGIAMPPQGLSNTIVCISHAYIMSPVLAGVIIMIDKLGDRGLIQDFTATSIMAQTGLFTGLLWERAFDSAVNIISPDLMRIVQTGEASQPIANCFSGVTSLAVVLTIYPAWKWFILPVAVLPMPSRDGDDSERLFAISSMSASSMAFPSSGMVATKTVTEVVEVDGVREVRQVTTMGTDNSEVIANAMKEVEQVEEATKAGTEEKAKDVMDSVKTGAAQEVSDLTPVQEKTAIENIDEEN